MAGSIFYIVIIVIFSYRFHTKCLKLKKHVIIIGGGIAGLAAASELSQICNVTIIESRNRVGGRIHTITLDGGCIVEAGAEFVHGNLPHTNRLIKEAALTKLEIAGKMYRVDESGWHEQVEMIEGWDILLAKLKYAEDSQTMQQFLDENFPPEKYYALRQHVAAYVSGFDVAALHEVSASSLYDEWSAEEENFRIKEGYSAIADYLASKAKANGSTFIMEDSVVSIDWKPGEVLVTTQAGKKVSGTFVLITAPVPVLTPPSSIVFDPSIDEYLSRFGQIGFGEVIKVIVVFNEIFWRDDLSFIFSGEQIPTWWTQHPSANAILTGWAGGPMAEKLSILSNEDLLGVAYTSLSRIFNMNSYELSTKVMCSYVFNWKTSGNGPGAYSFATPQTKMAREILAKGVSGTLFFAGEGLTGGANPGTVEAALISAAEAAKKIKKLP